MDEYIGKNIKLLRKEARLTIEELASESEISIERLEEIETNETKVFTKELMVLCPILHISEEDIRERNLEEERRQAEINLKGSKSRTNYNWYYGDKKKILFYVLNLILVPVVFFVAYLICNKILPIIFQPDEFIDMETCQMLIKRYQIIYPYIASSITSLVFMVIELFKKVKIPLYYWYLFFIGIIISLLFIAGIILLIPFYIYCIYQIFVKKGKNR